VRSDDEPDEDAEVGECQDRCRPERGDAGEHEGEAERCAPAHGRPDGDEDCEPEEDEEDIEDR
jgi:hypothetical protein